MKLPLVAVFLLAITLGCSKGATSDGLDCTAVADKVVEVLRADLGKLSDPQRKALEAQLATIRSEIIEDCRRDPEFFAAKADCIIKATSAADLDSCEGKGAEPKSAPGKATKDK